MSIAICFIFRPYVTKKSDFSTPFTCKLKLLTDTLLLISSNETIGAWPCITFVEPEIDNISMANTDSLPRSVNGKLGKYKRGDYNTIVLGTEMEGIIVEVDQTNIEYFYLEVKYNE